MSAFLLAIVFNLTEKELISSTNLFGRAVRSFWPSKMNFSGNLFHFKRVNRPQQGEEAGGG
jgi:hypothetical protein